jgi:hypothetical protein
MPEYLSRMHVKEELIQVAPGFKILTEISSYPCELFVCKDLVTFFNFFSLCVIKCNVWEMVIKMLKHMI